MNMLSRFFVFLYLIASGLISITTVSAQNLARHDASAAFPNDERNADRFLLRGRTLHGRAKTAASRGA